MTNNVAHPLNRSRCNLGDLRSNSTFKAFCSALHAHLDELRAEYEDQEANEFTRGKVQAVKEILNQLAEQNIR